jgi:hypothetical protein
VEALSEHSERNRLRHGRHLGLAQYLVVPLLLALSVVQGFKSRTRWMRTIAIGCCLIGLIALIMMYHRGYYSSLGLLNVLPRGITRRWTGARAASFSTCSIRRGLNLVAAPGQLRRWALT